jgi:hypothetical protein
MEASKQAGAMAQILLNIFLGKRREKASLFQFPFMFSFLLLFGNVVKTTNTEWNTDVQGYG